MYPSSRPRILNRSQTGPVGDPTSRIQSRSSSANGGIRSASTSSGSSTPKLIKVEPRRPVSQPHSLDLSRISLDSCSSSGRPSSLVSRKTPLVAVPSNDMIDADRTRGQMVLPFLDIGTPETASNAKYLCDQNIRYVVNLTGVARESIKIGRQERCDCNDMNEHKPVELVIRICERADPEELVSKFPQVNRLIEEARSRTGKRVLIFSQDGGSLCHLFTIQHIMFYFQVPILTAVHQFEHNIRSKIFLSENMRKSLELWEKKQTETQKESKLEKMASQSSQSSSASSLVDMPLIRRRQTFASIRQPSQESTGKKVAWQ